MGSTRYRIALAVALAGLVVSGVILDVERRLTTETGYTSFCNLGGAVNCDLVLSSRYATFLDLPVALWSGAVFVVGALAAIPGAFLGVTGGLADLTLIGLASGTLGFSLALAGVMAFILHYACLLCLTLDVVALAWFATVLPLVRNFDGSAHSPLLRRRGAARATAALALLATLAGGTFAAMRTPPTAQTAAEVEALDAAFVKQYLGLPVRPLTELLRADAPSKGSPSAPLTIVEFSDFQCPACGHAFKDLHELTRTRTDIRLVFRHFPLDSSCNEAMPRALHPDACQAAIAAECAGRQSRFWEYHDLLFANQRTLDRDSLFRYAREVGVDIAAFRTCLDDPATKSRIADDVRAGIAAGVESTPTLFINGRRVDGALEPPYYDYALALERERGGTAPGRP